MIPNPLKRLFSPRRLPAVLLGACLAAPATPSPGAPPGDLPVTAAKAFADRDYDRAIAISDKILQENPSDKKIAGLRAQAFQRRGEARFRAARIAESISDFDEFLKYDPRSKPHHWQRGISLYYAGRFVDGQKQFETHQTVNPQDVENAVWHFLCVSKVKDLGPDEARKRFIEITADRRVPMKEIHALFKGTGAEEAVIEAAESASGDRDNARCYAHLYLGLYHEALGDAKTSLDHIRKAAVDYAQDHYMGAVAKVHLKLRTKK